MVFGSAASQKHLLFLLLFYISKWKSLSRVWLFLLYSSWNSPGENTRVGSLSLLQGIFPSQGSNPSLPHCRQILYQLSHKGSPFFFTKKFLFLLYFTLQYCIGFAIHWHESTTGVHAFPNMNPPPTGKSLFRIQFSSVAQSCLTLCDPMNCSTPGLPIHHQFPEFTQTHVHWVGDAIQPSHPLSSPSIYLQMLNQFCLPRVSPTWSWGIILFMHC